jgi:signal transduction histidine kinase
LGLAIARRLAERDGGSIELADAPGGGLEVIVRLRT